MKGSVTLSELRSTITPTPDVRAQLAEYVAQQPASKQAFHRGMRIAEWVSLAFPVAVFAIALYVSITWRTVPSQVIATAWLCFPLSFTPVILLIGSHAIGLRAFPPTGLLSSTLRVSLPGPGSQVPQMLPLRLGSQALSWGWGLIVAALVGAAFCGAFIWATWTADMALIGAFIQVISTLLGILIVLRIAVSIYGKLSGTR